MKYTMMLWSQQQRRPTVGHSLTILHPQFSHDCTPLFFLLRLQLPTKHTQFTETKCRSLGDIPTFSIKQPYTIYRGGDVLVYNTYVYSSKLKNCPHLPIQTYKRKKYLILSYYCKMNTLIVSHSALFIEIQLDICIETLSSYFITNYNMTTPFRRLV